MKESGNFEDKSGSNFKIENFEMPNGNAISSCPERGIVTSLKLKGEEILYMDNETLQNKEVSVKGGIPVLFPNAGPIPEKIKNGELSDLPQHGPARNQQWKSIQTTEGVDLTLNSNVETKKVYPYDFNLSVSNRFEKDGSITITEEVQNLESNKDLPISMGLHPYFKVPNELKKDIQFNFEGGKFIEENIDKWANGKYIWIENPNTPMEVQIPNLGKLTFKVSPEYKKIWIWSQPGKDFICIEPVMRDVGGIIDDPEIVKSNQKFSANLNLSLEK